MREGRTRKREEESTGTVDQVKSLIDLTQVIHLCRLKGRRERETGCKQLRKQPSVITRTSLSLTVSAAAAAGERRVQRRPDAQMLQSRERQVTRVPSAPDSLLISDELTHQQGILMND